MNAARSKPAKDGGEFARAERAAKFILAKTKLRPKIALVLGSGLGAFADEFAGATRIPSRETKSLVPSAEICHASTVGKRALR